MSIFQGCSPGTNPLNDSPDQRQVLLPPTRHRGLEDHGDQKTMENCSPTNLKHVCIHMTLGIFKQKVYSHL